MTTETPPDSWVKAWAGKPIDFDIPDGAKARPAIYDGHVHDENSRFSVVLTADQIDADLMPYLHHNPRPRGSFGVTSGRRVKVVPVVEVAGFNLSATDTETAERFAAAFPEEGIVVPANNALDLPPIDRLVRELARLDALNLPRDAVFEGRRMVVHSMVAVKGVNYDPNVRHGSPPKPDAALWLQGITLYL
jgi:hypothetical protein